MRKFQLFLLMLLVGVQAALAQSVQVTGKVTYADDGTPVIGATVNVKGTTIASATDLNGEYKITIPSNAQKVLVFKALGLETAELQITTPGAYNVVMKTDALQASDVVVTGYGSARRAGTTVGSSVKVSPKSIESRPTASVFDALQGKVPGLQVYTSSGEPGTVQSVRLHGIGSLTASNTPLYVMDGVPVESRTVLAMNPNDFESVTVLKDASATSIYGSRAANGVIYISTKRGTFDSKARVTVRGQYGISSLANKEFYNQMMSTNELWDFWRATGVRTPGQITSLQNNLKNDKIVDKNGNFHDTRWIDYMQPDNRPNYQADISIQGGGKAVSYYVSGSMYNEEGLAIGSKYDRYTVRSNIDAKVNSWIKVGMNILLSMDKKQGNAQYGTNSLGGGLSYLYQPFYSPYSQDGSTPKIIEGLGSPNPHYYMDTHPDLYTRYGITGNTFVELEPVKNLKIKSSLGLDQSLTRNSWKTYPSYLGSLGNGLVGESTGNTMNATITNTVEYAWNINDKNKLTFLVGHEGVSYNYEYYSASSRGQTDDRLMNLNNGIQSTYTTNQRATASNFLSFFGRADYSYDNRFFFDASVRNDASSRFSKNNRSATFWAVGGMWNLKNESWLKDNNTITGLNLRASYGTQGNSSFVYDVGGVDMSDYPSRATVAETTKYGQEAAWMLGSPGNEDLKWEKQSKLTIGVNINLWNKLTVGVEYYNRVTNDMLMQVPIPYTTGFDAMLKNVGSLANNGIDISIDYNILSGKDYFLNFNANFNYNTEKITKLFDGRQRWEIANTGVAYVVGKPVMYYYPIYAGVNPETGHMQWYKAATDKDGNIDPDKTNKDPNNVTEDFDEAALTQSTGLRRFAPISGGFGINAGWKGIGLQMDFIYVLGKNLISNDRFFSENPWQFAGYNTSSNVNDYWQKPGDVKQYPNWADGNPIMQFDTHLLEDASFLRLKNLTVSYDFPSQLLKNSKSLTGFKVFFTARNLFTVTQFQGVDPEVDSNLSLGRAANTRQFSFGLNLYF